MRWFRLRQRWGTCLALAALVVQLVVASGHIHLDPADHDHSHIAHAGLHGDDAAVAAAAHEHDAHEHDPSGVPAAPDHRPCAACALIQLAQSLLAPAAPVLAPPNAIERQPVSESATALTAPEPARFRARAPPFA